MGMVKVVILDCHAANLLGSGDFSCRPDMDAIQRRPSTGAEIKSCSFAIQGSLNTFEATATSSPTQ
jgi:hypothetical protein